MKYLVYVFLALALYGLVKMLLGAAFLALFFALLIRWASKHHLCDKNRT